MLLHPASVPTLLGNARGETLKYTHDIFQSVGFFICANPQAERDGTAADGAK
jgi:hypothetical protein